MSKTVSIPIPANAEPGDTLSFEIDGTELELVVPLGCQPGDVLQVQLAETASPTCSEDDDSVQGSANDETNNGNMKDDGSIKDDDDQEEAKSKITIRLSSGQNLILATDELSSRTTIDYATTTNTFPNDSSREEENMTCDGTHAMAWHSGNWLVECLSRCDAWRDKLYQEVVHSRGDDEQDDTMTVLELGSGLGALGLVFGFEVLGNQVSHVSSRPALIRIVLTDVPTAIPLLQRNVDQNQHLFPTHIQLSAQPLMWTTQHIPPSNVKPQDEPITSSHHYDWIIGSDLLYNTESIPALVETMGRCLHPTRGSILLAVRWRKPELERVFFQQTSDRFAWEWKLLLPPDDDHVTAICPLSWEEFGNAECERSNRYFHSTCIAVHESNGSNNIKAIGEISVADVEAMSDEAFQTWERAHVQFYLGRPRQDAKSVTNKSKKQRLT